MADAIKPTFKFDEAAEPHTVTFRYRGETCIAIVDDYYGSIIDLYWIVDE